MKYFSCLLGLVFTLHLSAQVRPINKNTLNNTYTVKQIPAGLVATIDATVRAEYFKDDFYNTTLSGILSNSKYTTREKTWLFYLMQKRIGYGFVGVEYLPPDLNYYDFMSGKIKVYTATRQSLAAIKGDPKPFIALGDSLMATDVVLAGNAYLLAQLLDSKTTNHHLTQLLASGKLLTNKFGFVLNHYVCIALAIAQDDKNADVLKKCLDTYSHPEMIEDVFCALYSRQAPVALIRKYILREVDPKNEVAIQTALCALAAKVPEASFKESLTSLSKEVKEEWKKKIIERALNNGEIQLYMLTKKDQVVIKIWKGVEFTEYTDGHFVFINGFMEFDANWLVSSKPIKHFCDLMIWA